MSRIDDNKQQKKDRLMDAAFDLYTSQGIVKTTIDDIVKRSGIAKGTFYLYFKDKYDLQEKLIAHKSKQIFDHALSHSGCEELATVEERVLALVDDILDQLKNEKHVLRFIYKNLSWGVFRRAIDRSDTDFLALLISAINAPVDPKTLEIEIYTIFELLSSTCYSVILDDEPCDLDTYMPYLHRSIIAILRSFE
ncbi:MAG: TetR/AcrR family transcriptional regulator [Firmicutes bacterium]|nr:TetR/AcrR family transcriptional regulator [Bacillota bacterium]